MTELKELAREATEGATEHAEEAWESLAGVVNKAVRPRKEGWKLEETEEVVR
jgi:hypothetical protein